MSVTITSANMGLPVPVVSVDPGPDYAVNVNTCLTTIDSHNHTVGKGVPVPSSGLNINSDLTFQSNNAVALRTARFTSQSNPLALGSDVGAVYVVNADLYYNDTAGNIVRMTQGGSVAGAAGSISGLVAPATASYSAVGKSFIWQSDVSTPANLDAGSVIFRNVSASSNGVTVQAPAALGVNYNLTLPLAPANTSFLGIDSSGNISAVASVTAGITKSYLAPLGQVVTSSVSWTGTSSNIATVTSLTITTTGRPVMIMLIGGGGITASSLSLFNTGSQTGGIVRIAIGSTSLTQQELHASNYSPNVTAWSTSSISVTQNAFTQLIVPANLQHMDFPSAGTYTYLLQGYVDRSFEGANQQFSMTNVRLVAWEL